VFFNNGELPDYRIIAGTVPRNLIEEAGADSADSTFLYFL